MARDEARIAADGTAGQHLGGGEASRGEGWGTGDLALMCADLGEACQARGLQGANNWAGLARALAVTQKTK